MYVLQPRYDGGYMRRIAMQEQMLAINLCKGVSNIIIGPEEKNTNNCITCSTRN